MAAIRRHTWDLTNGDSKGQLAILVFLTAALFTASAIYALHGLVKTREWNWGQPREIEVRDPNGRAGLARRASYLYEDFANNWEITDVKVEAATEHLCCFS